MHSISWNRGTPKLDHVVRVGFVSIAPFTQPKKVVDSMVVDVSSNGQISFLVRNYTLGGFEMNLIRQRLDQLFGRSDVLRTGLVKPLHQR